MFTKRHYITLGTMIGDELAGDGRDSSAVIQHWCQFFTFDNERFDSNTFTNFVNDIIDVKIARIKANCG